MTRRAPLIASWANTGRRVERTPEERQGARLEDLRRCSALIREHLPPLLAKWLADGLDAFDDELARGGRPNLQRILGLPDRRRRKGIQRRMLRERNCAIRAVANALAPELAPWTRASMVAALLEEHNLAGPAAARGELAILRNEILGRPPTSTRSLYRIIARPH